MIEALLGIDVGTTSTKAVLFNREGQELARAVSAAYRNQSPQPGWVEQDPEEVWAAVLSVLTQIGEQKGAQTQIKAISMAVQSGSLIPADQDGEPVYPLITWLDGRSAGLVQSWRESGVEEWVKPISGWPLITGLCLPNIAWLRDNNPAVFQRSRHYFSVNDFIAYRLTGIMISNPSNAGGMQLVDLHSGDWSQSLCELAGIRPEMLSQMTPSGAVIGALKPGVCQTTGITPGSLLINGGHDQVCTALGLGINDPGKYLLACGTAWVFTGILNSPDLEGLLPVLSLNFHAYPQRWTLSQSLGGLGASQEWWLQNAWQGSGDILSRRDTYARLNDAMRSTHPNADLFFLPMTGGHADPATTQRGGFIGLDFNHTRADMTRAIMESAGYELRWALDTIRSTNQPVEKLWMVGGASQSSVWPAILAEITGLPIELPQYDNWPALGAAVLAGVGSGVYSSVEEALGFLQKPAKQVAVQAHNQNIYARGFQNYKEILQKIR